MEGPDYVKPGDLLLVKPGTNVPPGTRYSRGLVLEEVPKLHAAKIMWCDSFIEINDVMLLDKHYERIATPHETR
jgi:hypothetical protein